MARRHAQAGACQTKLHYTGLLLATYVHDHDGMLPPSYNAPGTWPFTYEPNPAYPELALCPAATILAPRERLSWGGTFSAWTADLNSNDFEHGLWLKDFNLLGSYGRNAWAFLKGGAGKSAWGTTLVRQAYEIPLYMDCTTPNMGPFPYDSPPEHEDADRDWSMSCSCIDRHHGGINTLFLDWSVRKVGLKELWTLKWHHQFDTAGPWTKAGGVEPEDWPQWMRKFEDYYDGRRSYNGLAWECGSITTLSSRARSDSSGQAAWRDLAANEKRAWSVARSLDFALLRSG